MGYDLHLSDGDLLTTISLKTVDTRLATSLVLIGQGVPDLWKANDQNFAWLLENFSKATPPPHPLTGQTWHNSRYDRLAVYTGTDWDFIETMETSSTGLFEMLPTATDIDFTQTGSTAIFRVTDQTKEYLPTAMVLVPDGHNTATHRPIIEVSTLTPEDILISTSIPIDSGERYIRLPTNSLCRIVSDTPTGDPYGESSFGRGLYSRRTSTPLTVSINVTTAATGGDLHYDAYLFGFVRDISL